MTDIKALTDAILRAEQNPATDEDNEKFKASKDLVNFIMDVIEKYSATLGTILILKAVACVLGAIIKRHRAAGPISGAIIASEICQITIDIATQD